MTLESFLQNYDPLAKYKFFKDYDGVLLLTPYITRPHRIIHMLNPQIASSYKPKARQDLPMESQNEGVHCNSCHSTLAIRRVRPKITSSLILSNQYSSYSPQEIQFCMCRAMAVKVDDRGRLRVYGEANNIALVNYLEGFPIHHQLSHQKHAEIDRALLDAPRVVYDLPKPRYMWTTNFIDLTMPIEEQQLLLPVDTAFKNRKVYLQTYAYKFKAVILTKYYLILPSGVAIPTKDPILSNLLDRRIDTPSYVRDIKNVTYRTILGSAKLNEQILEHANSIIEEIIETLNHAYSLPQVPSKRYPFQLIGYLHVVHLGDNWSTSLGYCSEQYHRCLMVARNAARSYFRSMLLGLPQKYTPRTLDPLPPSALLLTNNFKLKPKVTLYWARGKLRL